MDKLWKICIVDNGPKIINDDQWRLGLYHGDYNMDNALEDLETIKTNWLEFASKFIDTMTPYFSEQQKMISMLMMKNNSPDIMYKFWRSMIEKDYRPILSRITIPTLIIFGGRSSFYSVDVGGYLHKEIKDSKFELFEDSTHLLVLEDPIKFNRVLEEFISEK